METKQIFTMEFDFNLLDKDFYLALLNEILNYNKSEGNKNGV